MRASEFQNFFRCESVEKRDESKIKIGEFDIGYTYTWASCTIGYIREFTNGLVNVENQTLQMENQKSKVKIDAFIVTVCSVDYLEDNLLQ